MDSTLASELASVRAELKSMHKLLRKIRATQEDPTGEKTKERAARSGFNRLQRVSPELAEFLGLSSDEGISRGQVTSRITRYVNENNLKSPTNGRVIMMDDKLRRILKDVPDDIELKITNLQTYLKGHYIGPFDEATPPAAPESATPVTVKKVIKRPVVKKTAA
jgi:upstream activation factor subunit UAF30